MGNRGQPGRLWRDRRGQPHNGRVASVNMTLQYAWCELRRRKARTSDYRVGVWPGRVEHDGHGRHPAGIGTERRRRSSTIPGPTSWSSRRPIWRSCGPCLAVANSQIRSRRPGGLGHAGQSDTAGLCREDQGAAHGDRRRTLPAVPVSGPQRRPPVYDRRFRSQQRDGRGYYLLCGHGHHRWAIPQWERQGQGPRGTGLCPVAASQGGKTLCRSPGSSSACWGSSTRESGRPGPTSICPIRRRSVWWLPNCPMSPSQVMPI